MISKTFYYLLDKVCRYKGCTCEVRHDFLFPNFFFANWESRFYDRKLLFQVVTVSSDYAKFSAII